MRGGRAISNAEGPVRVRFPSVLRLSGPFRASSDGARLGRLFPSEFRRFSRPRPSFRPERGRPPGRKVAAREGPGHALGSSTSLLSSAITGATNPATESWPGDSQQSDSRGDRPDSSLEHRDRSARIDGGERECRRIPLLSVWHRVLQLQQRGLGGSMDDRLGPFRHTRGECVPGKLRQDRQPLGLIGDRGTALTGRPPSRNHDGG